MASHQHQQPQHQEPQQREEWIFLGDLCPGTAPHVHPISVVTTTSDTNNTSGVSRVNDDNPQCQVSTNSPVITLREAIRTYNGNVGWESQSMMIAHDNTTARPMFVSAEQKRQQPRNNSTSTSNVHRTNNNAHGGENKYQYQIQRYSLTDTTAQPNASFEATGKPVPIPEEPRAMFLYKTAVYLGFYNSVGWIDFSDMQPQYEYEQLYVNPNATGKCCYDMFAFHSGRQQQSHSSYLIAIDDCACPFFADTFILDWKDRGRPIHIRHWELPTLVNGNYTMAVATSAPCPMVSQPKAETGLDKDHKSNNSLPSPYNQQFPFHLILTTSFSTRRGSGQTLMRLSHCPNTFASPSIGCSRDEWHKPDGSLENSLSGNTIVGTREDSSLSWEEPFVREERWLAMAAANHNKLLMATNRQGLLSLPLDFDASTQANAAAVFPPDWAENHVVKDVIVIGKEHDVWVLLAPIPDIWSCSEASAQTLLQWQLVKLTPIIATAHKQCSGSSSGKLDPCWQVQRRIPISGGPQLHFAGSNGRSHSSFRSLEDSRKAALDNANDL